MSFIKVEHQFVFSLKTKLQLILKTLKLSAYWVKEHLEKFT